MAQKARIEEYSDGNVTIYNLRNNIGVPVFGLNEMISASRVTQYWDGTPMDDSKVDNQLYLQLKSLPDDSNTELEKYVGDYFKVNLPNEGELFLEKDTMQEMRDLNSTEILLLQMGYFKGVKLNGYYAKGDTPAPIEYYLSETTEEDDGGSVIEVGGIKLEHEFREVVDASYFGVKNDSIHDDAISIQNAIGSVLKGEVIIPECKISSPITLNKRFVTLRGRMFSTTITTLPNFSGDAALTIDLTGQGTTQRTNNGLKNIRIQGLADDMPVIGLRLLTAGSTNISSVYVYNFGTGVYAQNTYNTLFNGIRVLYCSKPYELDGCNNMNFQTSQAISGGDDFTISVSQNSGMNTFTNFSCGENGRNGSITILGSDNKFTNLRQENGNDSADQFILVGGRGNKLENYFGARNARPGVPVMVRVTGYDNTVDIARAVTENVPILLTKESRNNRVKISDEDMLKWLDNITDAAIAGGQFPATYFYDLGVGNRVELGRTLVEDSWKMSTYGYCENILRYANVDQIISAWGANNVDRVKMTDSNDISYVDITKNTETSLVRLTGSIQNGLISQEDYITASAIIRVPSGSTLQRFPFLQLQTVSGGVTHSRYNYEELFSMEGTKDRWFLIWTQWKGYPEGVTDLVLRLNFRNDEPVGANFHLMSIGVNRGYFPHAHIPTDAAWKNSSVGYENFSIAPTSSEESRGLIKLATLQEVDSGTDNSKAITPLTLQTKLDDRVATTTVKGLVNQATASADSASSVGETYTQSEVQAILNELRDLKAKMRTAGMLNS